MAQWKHQQILQENELTLDSGDLHHEWVAQVKSFMELPDDQKTAAMDNSLVASFNDLHTVEKEDLDDDEKVALKEENKRTNERLNHTRQLLSVALQRAEEAEKKEKDRVAKEAEDKKTADDAKTKADQIAKEAEDKKTADAEKAATDNLAKEAEKQAALQKANEEKKNQDVPFDKKIADAFEAKIAESSNGKGEIHYSEMEQLGFVPVGGDEFTWHGYRLWQKMFMKSYGVMKEEITQTAV